MTKSLYTKVVEGLYASMKEHGFVRSSDPSGLSVKQKLIWAALPFASGPK